MAALSSPAMLSTARIDLSAAHNGMLSGKKQDLESFRVPFSSIAIGLPGLVDRYT